MNILTLDECGLVAGGLRSRSAVQSQAQLRGAGTINPAVEVPIYDGGIGSGSSGGAGYYGYLGDMYGVGNYAGDAFFDVGAQYSGASVESGDKVVVSPAVNPVEGAVDNAIAWLENSAGGEIVQGTLEMAGGVIATSSGLVATVGSDGLLLPSVGVAGMAFGVTGIVQGITTIKEGALRLERQ